MNAPGAGLHLVGQAQALQTLQAADQQQALALQPRFVEAFDLHLAIVADLALERAIQARPPFLLHLAPQGLLDLQLGAWPQPFGRQLGRAIPKAIGDVVARDDEVFAGVVAPAHDQVGVRVVGVPVIDSHPFQPRAQVGFHAPHQMPRVGAQVFELGAILGGNDEAEMVPVVGAAFLEGIKIGFIGLRPVGPAWLTVPAHAIALDVAQVLGERLRAGLALVDQQRLDGHAPRHGRELRPREARRRVAAPQARTGPLAGAPPGAASRPRTAHRGLAAAGLACLLEHLGDKALAAILRGAGADAEIVVAAVGHGCAPCKLRRVRSCKARGHVCIGAGHAPPAARRRSRAVPRHPHVQTGFAGRQVPPPFVLPSAFAPRCRSGRRRPGGAALLAASAPANAQTSAMRAAAQARSRQDACTLDGCAEGSARRGANAPALHARRHVESHRTGTPDSTMTRSESAPIMAVSPARPVARRRSRRTR